MPSSSVSTGTIGRTGPNISLKQGVSAQINSWKKRSTVLGHQRIIPRTILHDGRRDEKVGLILVPSDNVRAAGCIE